MIIEKTDKLFITFCTRQPI